MTHLIERFTEILKKGKYNINTITAYRNAIFVFYNHFRDYPQNRFTDELISDYIIEIHNKSNKADALMVGKAIKLFFKVIFSRELNLTISGKSREDQTIEILTKEDIKKLNDTIKNSKHRLIIMLIYAHGLKINELINLQVKDIDLETRILNVRSAGPKKIRNLRIPKNIIEELQNYLIKYVPTQYLFMSTGSKDKYSARNIQLFFQKALIDSNLNKSATISSLRHSYAVHLLESGIDIHILKEMLGHSNLQTTAAYSPFVMVSTTNINSPFESI